MEWCDAARRLVALGALGATLAGCRTPDPSSLLEVSDVETYWAVDPSLGGENYIAPTVRFQVKNRSAAVQRSVQATATFRRRGEENLTWGSAFLQVSSRPKPLEPGQSILVVLKSEGRYHSSGTPDQMLANAEFKDAKVEFFLRVGSSPWVSFGQADIERRVGSRAAVIPAP